MQTLSLTEKIEDELYPILGCPDEQPNDLIQFVKSKFAHVKTEIQQAERELNDRIQTIGQLEAKDQVSNEKIVQVKNNLNSIKTKLFTVSADYDELVQKILTFLQAYQRLYETIQNYFGQDVKVKSYANFREDTMENFRSLLGQSEEIIERIRNQEPPVAKEQDTDKIITLLERLRIFFESNAAVPSSESGDALNEFLTSCKDLHDEIDDLQLQFNDIVEKFGESAAAYKITSLSYGYYKRNVDVSDVLAVDNDHETIAKY